MMKVCYLCDDEITKFNESEEHIILNACGGRLKAKNLVCKSCNSQYGSSYDAALAKTTNALTNLLLLKRERGSAQPIYGKLSGTEDIYKILADGTSRAAAPTIKKTVTDDRVNFSVIARDEIEFSKILNGLKKKYPLLDIDEASRVAKRKDSYFDKPIEFEISVGGPEVFKSITKSAVNFYLYSGGKREYIKHIIPYLKEEVLIDIVWLHYPQKKVYVTKDNEVSHVLHIYGCPNERILYAYIELFNTDCYIIKLNENYDGVFINNTYAYDLIEGVELKDAKLHTYQKKEIVDFIENKNAKPFEEVQKRYDRVMSIARIRQDLNYTNSLFKQGLQNSWGKYPQGTKITREMVDEAVIETMKLLSPWIAHRLSENEKFDDMEDLNE